MSEKRLRNTATVLVFPLIDYTTGEYYTGTWAGLTNGAITAYHWSDGVAPQALSIAGTPTQIGSTGLWQLSLSASELNISSQYVIIKFDADELAAQGVTIDLVDSLNNSDVLSAIGDLNNISVANILADQSIKDALTVLIGNHAISGSTLTHTRTGADNVAFTITETSKTRA